MWSVIFSQPEIEQHSGLRKHLLNQLNYELAYSEVIHSDRFDEDVRKDFTIAVGRSYQQMHEAFYVSGIRIPATGVCRAIVGAFAGTGANERGFVFTLNQDLLMERFFTNGSHSRFDLWIPGIDNFGCFNYTLREFRQRTTSMYFQAGAKFKSYNPIFGMIQLTVNLYI